jgi:hypothetical protein
LPALVKLAFAALHKFTASQSLTAMKLLFLKKKKQKDFYPFGLGGCRPGRSTDRSSLVLSFKKKQLFLSLRHAECARKIHNTLQS